jgi:hypothetical protein
MMFGRITLGLLGVVVVIGATFNPWILVAAGAGVHGCMFVMSRRMRYIANRVFSRQFTQGIGIDGPEPQGIRKLGFAWTLAGAVVLGSLARWLFDWRMAHGQTLASMDWRYWLLGGIAMVLAFNMAFWLTSRERLRKLGGWLPTRYRRKLTNARNHAQFKFF